MAGRNGRTTEPWKRTPERFSLETDAPSTTSCLHGRFVKICFYVHSEQELLRLDRECRDAGLLCALIKHAGLTEFKGTPTYTAIGIRPARTDEIDAVMGGTSAFLSFTG